MTITLYQESGNNWREPVRYFVVFRSPRHCRCRKVSKESWLAIMDHYWNNPMFVHTKFDVNYHDDYNGVRVTVWRDEFEGG